MRSIIYAGNDFSEICSAEVVGRSANPYAVEAVVIDCVTESVRVNDADARDAVSLGSDFFALDPGACSLLVTGCRYLEVRFSERWV